MRIIVSTLPHAKENPRSKPWECQSSMAVIGSARWREPPLGRFSFLDRAPDLLAHFNKQGSETRREPGQGKALSGSPTHVQMSEGPAPLDVTQQPRWAPPTDDEEGLEAESSGAAPAHVQELEELEASRRYKRRMLDDAASSTSFRKGGPRLPRAAQVTANTAV